MAVKKDVPSVAPEEISEEVSKEIPEEVRNEISKDTHNQVFEPRIVGFLCNWCSYAGADLAGVSRFQYPPNLRFIRVMCSSRVDPTIILEMLLQGADGVFIGGCHPGDCHYISGNYFTERKIKFTKKLISLTGLEPERLRLEWVSASEGQRFADVVSEFNNQIIELGPSPLRGDEPDLKLLSSIYAATNAAKDFRLKSLVGREIKLTQQGNVYNKIIPQERLDEVMDKAIMTEFARQRLFLATQNRPISVKELSKYLNIPSNEVLEHIITLKDRGLVNLDHIDGTTPYYFAEQGVVD
jgi:coenzyme F420-reducing hydrogenase delta subunit